MGGVIKSMLPWADDPQQCSFPGFTPPDGE